MRITPAAGSLWRRVLPDGTVVTPRFTVSDEREGVRVEMEVEIDERGHSRCLSFKATPIKDGGEIGQLPGVATLLREATAASAAWVSYGGSTSDGGHRFDALPAQARFDAYERQYRRTPAVRGDSPYTPEELQRVAEIVLRARAQDESVTQAVMDELVVSKATADRRIKAAKARGLVRTKS